MTPINSTMTLHLSEPRQNPSVGRPGSSIRAVIPHVCGRNSTCAWMFVLLTRAQERYISDFREKIYGMLDMMQDLLEHFDAIFGAVSSQ